jgi:ABC-type nitrate/sulfonate/bicarbonate transport system substrate-binding protein
VRLGRRDVLKIGVSVAAAAPLLAACGEESTPGGLTSWRSGTINPTVPDGFVLMCVEQGYLEEEGLDVTFTSSNSAELIRAAVSNRLDIVLLAPGAGFSAAEAGSDVRMVGVPWNKVRDFIYASSDITSPADLVGKSIAIQAPNTSSAILVNAVLEHHGIRPDQVDMVQTGGDSERIAALLSGRVDATVAGIENLPVIEQDPNFTTLLSVGEIVPDVLGAAWFSTGRVISERSEDLTKVLRAYTRGLRYALDHLDEATDVAVERLLTPAADVPVVAAAIQAHRDNQIINPNLSWTDQQVTATQQLNVDTGSQNQVMPPDEVADRRFADQVLEELGEYEW